MLAVHKVIKISFTFTIWTIQMNAWIFIIYTCIIINIKYITLNWSMVNAFIGSIFLHKTFQCMISIFNNVFLYC